jgi:hypothetical protein
LLKALSLIPLLLKALPLKALSRETLSLMALSSSEFKLLSGPPPYWPSPKYITSLRFTPKSGILSPLLVHSSVTTRNEHKYSPFEAVGSSNTKPILDAVILTF